jgi:hypothetical protein
LQLDNNTDLSTIDSVTKLENTGIFMRTIVIHHAASRTPLYSGRFATVRSCLEQAATENADLSGADLRHANLASASLDGLCLRGARLDGANLVSANLSEACLDGSILAGAALQNACLCFGSFKNCDFTGAQFGATDIAGAALDGARFSTPSAFTLNFRDARSLLACLYIGEENRSVSSFSRPPLVLTGLAQPVAILDRDIQIGPVSVPLERAGLLFGGYRQGQWLESQGFYAFLTALRQPLQALLRYRGMEMDSVNTSVCG